MVRIASALLALSSSTSFLFGYAASVSKPTCGDMKSRYKQETCCGASTKELNLQIVPGPKITLDGPFNPCHEKKPAWENHECVVNGIVQAVEQAGGDVTKGFTGGLATNVTPISQAYYKAGLCPVNVHWHLGTEHRSVGEYDENGSGPGKAGTPSHAAPTARRLATSSAVQYGYACSKYDANDAKFTTDYHWDHCVGMQVGETYEVHWPHSALGACHTPNQYQTPFYDGVFCGYDGVSALPAATVAGAVGVQSQVFVIVNDETYYYPDLMRGMIVDGLYGKNITAYTGSTTGVSRDNNLCSAYGPITWQVDRTCHLISASTFDKMCADMKQQRDDMSDDLHAHGSRDLVATHLTAHNQVDLAASR